MRSLMARLTLLVYLLSIAALLLHPCLCHETAASQLAAAVTSNWRLDSKAIDQGVAYVLMLVTLFITYIVHRIEQNKT